MTLFERMPIPSLGGATAWLNSQPLTAEYLRKAAREIEQREVRKGTAKYLRRHHALQKLYRARLIRY